MKETHRYDDIIYLEHPEPRTRKRMPMGDRAAQFSPFAALTGYEDAVKETARHTELDTELSEDAKHRLNEKLRMLAERPETGSVVKITYFIPDDKKSGGAYVCVCGTLKTIDGHTRLVTMTDGTKIPIDRIRDVESELFGAWNF